MDESRKSSAGRTAGGAVSDAPRDRRATHRAAIEIPAVVHLGEEEFPCTILDLSAEGMAVSHRGNVPEDAAVRVVFRVPNAPLPLEVAGIVLRRQYGGRSATLGIRFILPSNRVTSAINTFVERNRTDLPFSQPHPKHDGGTASGRLTERDGDLQDLYRSAVDSSVKKEQRRRGFFGRWRRSGGS